MSMFCYQCEQTARGTGCTIAGVCGKDATTSNLQDLLIYGLEGLAMYAHRARVLGAMDEEIDRFTLEVLFTTVTNVNFDSDRLVAMLHRLGALKDRARQMYETASVATGSR
ncbi:MAG: hydroxylamine reductase, partial [Candidatus Eisenbacteria bacterium]|nr:hydroxylamine reductase [Candidatus Eisenbacteria bacterium]